MSRLKLMTVAAIVSLVAAGVAAGPAAAGHNEDLHSDNVRLLEEDPIIIAPDDPDTEDVNEESRAQGSDLAFQKNLLVAGSFEGVGLFKLRKSAPYVKQLSFLSCPGSQGDVSVYKDLVFMSVDQTRDKPECDSVAASQAQTLTRADWEGIRIISIKNPKRPEQIATVRTQCGSHTHTLVPSGNKVYVYVESYPLTSGLSSDCNVVTHRKISVIEVPLNAPDKAEVVTQPSLTTSIGCHDITAFPAKDLAVAACISESQVWNIEDPANPEILAKIYNPRMQIHHSTGITWDGKILVLGDEAGGATAPPGCTGNEQTPVGAMWFYDISDPSAPDELGYYAPPRFQDPPDSAGEGGRIMCTTHNFNIPPMKHDGHYVAVVSYYASGISVVDFSDPTSPQEIGYYLPRESGTNPDSWSAYWYNGFVYTNDFRSLAGIRIYEVDELTLKDAFPFKERLNPQTQIL